MAKAKEAWELWENNSGGHFRLTAEGFVRLRDSREIARCLREIARCEDLCPRVASRETRNLRKLATYISGAAIKASLV